MNVLYLIGNGFDLRLGLPTRYADFLDYYEVRCPLSNTSEAESVAKYKRHFFKKLREQLNSGNKQWKDLELALGKFTTEFGDDVEGFRNFYEDVNFALRDYLKEVTSNFHAEQEESDKLYKDLLYPYLYLTQREQNQFQEIVPMADHWVANVITFNYTSSFEILSNNVLSSGDVYRRDNGYSFNYKDIIHIHGNLEANEPEVLLGVDNIEQIDNTELKENEDVTDFLIKPQSNQNYGALDDEKCQKLISEARLICLFGLSLGETDKTWWTHIRQRFLSNDAVTLLYFHYEALFSPKMKRDLRPARRARQHILDALGIDGIEKDYRNRIFVSVNSDMFPKRDRKRG